MLADVSPLSGFPLVVIWVSLFLSANAAFANLHVAYHNRGWLRFSLLLTSALAAAYATSYAWLLAHPSNAAEWSQTMRPVGMVSWFVPWLLTPLLLHRRHLQHRAEVIGGE